MPDEIPWPTPEEETILDRINASVPPPTAAELAETARRCAEAKRYRLERAAAARDDDDLVEVPAQIPAATPIESNPWLWPASAANCSTAAHTSSGSCSRSVMTSHGSLTWMWAHRD